MGVSSFGVGWPSIGSIICWFIWKHSCDVAFRKKRVNLDKLLLDIKRFISTVIVPANICIALNISSKTEAHLVDSIIFIDASVKDSKLGIGLVLCTTGGVILKVRGDFGRAPDAAGGEAAALFLAISWCRDLKLSKVLLVSDCLNMVNYVNSFSGSVGWRSKDLDDCKISMSTLFIVKFVYVKRKLNNEADRLASFARKNSLSFSWDSCPSFLVIFVKQNSLINVCKNLVI